MTKYLRRLKDCVIACLKSKIKQLFDIYRVKEKNFTFTMTFDVKKERNEVFNVCSVETEGCKVSVSSINKGDAKHKACAAFFAKRFPFVQTYEDLLEHFHTNNYIK